uniref:Uncharacterized protein n=1 Tax=Setaria viridis TaxID=4556 RepID=A0A4U6W7C7_SETVI|nr:hypothetical protein SEVIR_1G041700v2 [Setaria viridis]
MEARGAHTVRGPAEGISAASPGALGGEYAEGEAEAGDGGGGKRCQSSRSRGCRGCSGRRTQEGVDKSDCHSFTRFFEQVDVFSTPMDDGGGGWNFLLLLLLDGLTDAVDAACGVQRRHRGDLGRNSPGYVSPACLVGERLICAENLK